MSSERPLRARAIVTNPVADVAGVRMAVVTDMTEEDVAVKERAIGKDGMEEPVVVKRKEAVTEADTVVKEKKDVAKESVEAVDRSMKDQKAANFSDVEKSEV